MVQFLLFCIYVIAKIAGIVIGLYNYKIFPLQYRILVQQVTIALIAELLGKYLNVNGYNNNSWVFNIYMLIEFVLICIAGIYFISRSSAKDIVKVVLIAFVLLWFLYWHLSSIGTLFNWFFVLSSLFSVMLYAYIMLTETLFRKKNVYDNPIFIISSSVILYFACTIPLFGAIKLLIDDNVATANQLYLINAFANILRYSLVAIAFYLYGRQAKRAYVR